MKDSQPLQPLKEMIKPQGQDRVLAFLHRLIPAPPNVLLLEGGSLQDRRQIGLYWTALLNCRDENRPCLSCSLCRQVQAEVFRDVFVFSGEEEAIKIEQVRSARSVMGQKPDQGRYRVILLHEAQELTPTAANSLLKAMEEPLPNNVFVLTAPLRNWLLPTLVSRSFVLTLNWRQERTGIYEEGGQWQRRLLNFWRTGQGLFEHTGKKGELDRKAAREVVTACQHSLLRAIQAADDPGPMAAYLSRSLTPSALLEVDLVLHKAQQALGLQTTPSLVLDWVAVQVWQLVHR